MPSSNPFWFGYYEGDRPLKRRVNPSGYSSFDISYISPEQLIYAIDTYLDKVVFKVLDASSLPGWLKKQIISDWKNSFTASAIGYIPPGSEAFQFEDTEGVELPGIQVSLNLYEFIKDPVKVGKQFLSNQILAEISPWRREFWTDLDTAITSGLYQELARGEGGILTKLLGYALSDEGKIAFKDQGVYDEDYLASALYDPRNPLPDYYKLVEGEHDVYASVGASFVDFVSQQKSTASRSKSYAGLQASMLAAAATELTQKKAALQAVASGISPQEAANMGFYIDTLLQEYKIVDGVTKFQKSVSEVSKTLGQKAFTPYTRDVSKIRVIAGDSSSTDPDAIKGKLLKNIEELEQAIADMRSHLEMAANSVTPQERGRYRERLKDFNRRIKRVEGTLEKARKLRDKLNRIAESGDINRLEMEALITEATLLSASLSHSRYGGGIVTEYFMEVSNEYFGKDYRLRKKYFSLEDPASGERIMSDGFRSLQAVQRYSRRQFLSQEGLDLIEAIVSGRFFERRYWYGKFKIYLQVFTPGYWTSKFLRKTGFLGLVYDESEASSYFLNKKNEYGEDTLKAKIGNLILRPLSRKNVVGFGYKVSINGRSFKVSGKIDGGAYLGSLLGIWERAGNNKLVGLVGPDGKWTAMGLKHTQASAFIAFLNGKEREFENATGLRFQIPAGAGGADFEEAKKAAATFKRKLTQKRWFGFRRQSLAEKMGLELDANGDIIDNEKNRTILDGFFKKMKDKTKRPGGISPFVSRVGLFNLLSGILTSIQYFEFLLLKPFVKPFIALREISKNMAAKIFRTVLYAILGSVSGGLGAFLVKFVGPILERVFNSVFARIWKHIGDGFNKAFTAFIRGDVSKAVDALVESSAKALAWLISCGCFIPISIMVLVIYLISPILSAIPSVDRVRKPEGISPPVGGPPQNLPSEDNFFISYSCFIKNARLTLGSYNPNGTIKVNDSNYLGTGHGSKYYWEVVKPRECPSGEYVVGKTVFSIPYMTQFGNGFECYGLSSGKKGNSCSPPQTAGAKCVNLERITSFYGFAADYVGGSAVYAPGFICGKKIEGDWSLRGSYRLARDSEECGLIMEAFDEDGKQIKANIMHLTNCPSVGKKKPGELVAPLYQSEAPHIHVELMKDGVSIRPEDCDCI
ncbi:MAG: hypothetical protein ABIK73_08745 [candidate division WOR-3 bacterium]